MTADPRAALALLVSALERHLEVATTRRDPDDPAVIGAAEALAAAVGLLRGRGGLYSVLSNTVSEISEDYILGCTNAAGDNYNPAATGQRVGTP